MKDFILFLHGPYYDKHLHFYRNLCRSRVKIAVDGGYRFFEKTGLVPDLLIGDLDSIKRVPGRSRSRTKVLSYPPRKDKTDSHLALEYCLEQSPRSIDIVAPAVGEVDHFLGNIMLLRLVSDSRSRRRQPRVRIVNIRHEIVLVTNTVHTFSGSVGDIVSVIPVSSSIGLSCKGTEYAVDGIKIRRGDSRGLRNRIVERKASFHIKGAALVVHRFRRTAR